MTALGALSFSAPLILTALLALPVVWLLLRATPPQPSRVRFPAFIILRRLARTEETPSKTPWWLLLLRLLAAAMIIAGIAGPILNAPPPSVATGPILLVVDDSWAAAPDWRLRRDAIEAAAEEARIAGRAAYLLTTTPELAPSPPELLSGADLSRAGAALQPKALAPDYAAAATLLDSLPEGAYDVRWLTDGLAHEGDDDFAERLSEFGVPTAYRSEGGALILKRQVAGALGAYVVGRVGPAATSGAVVATARDGRELARATFEFPSDADTATVTLDLPLALRNDVAAARIEGVASAGATQLSDGRDRRVLVGMLSTGASTQDALLRGDHYVRKALEPFAEFINGDLDTLMASSVSVIVLDDVGHIRQQDAERLRAWMMEGGVVIRFAGPTFADATNDGAPALTPAPLRAGGRAFGGALTWETPQPLGDFSANGPFADMAPPSDVLVRRQVLAAPGGETTDRTWASLGDGTPLVTGERIGAGALALFHTTATPDWSDLPLSRVFIDMLRRLAFLSNLGPEAGVDAAGARQQPLRILDGFGVLQQPGANLAGVTVAEAAEGPSAAHPPGYYGAPEAPIAVNAVGPDDTFAPFDARGVDAAAYLAAPPQRLGPPLLAAALIILLLDALVSLRLAGRLRFAALAVLMFAPFGVERAFAQPLDAPVPEQVEAAALATRLAYVRTGDANVDRLSESGLAALSRELARRTAVEPARPFGVDPETDDLSVYPLIYWPIVAGATAPSPEALVNIENFMRFGGLVVFDTRDDERAVAGIDTPERQALRVILGNVDTPPLTPLPADHVLTRSFYLLTDLAGRAGGNPVWVQSRGDANDGVTPLIIGGRDWAGAWATSDAGQPLMPMPRGGDRAREYAYRAGINMVMVALTGNYKSDQVHTPVLLERLGK